MTSENVKHLCTCDADVGACVHNMCVHVHGSTG